MNELLAGTACGFLMGSIVVVVGALMLISVPSIFPRSAQSRPNGTVLTPILAIVSVVIPILWGMIGGLLGLTYKLTSTVFPGAGLGSPNLIFTLAIFLVAVLAAMVLLATRVRLLACFLALTVAFAAIYGWLLPYMAG
ncbi:MAG: hypothetical protein ABIH46_11370 [Chloroflexota bacterium]